MSAILSLKWLPKKPAGKPETTVFLLEKPETAGFPKSQDCPQPTNNIANKKHRAQMEVTSSPPLFAEAACGHWLSSQRKKGA